MEYYPKSNPDSDYRGSVRHGGKDKGQERGNKPNKRTHARSLHRKSSNRKSRK